MFDSCPQHGLKQPPNFNRLVNIKHSIEFVVLNTLQQTAGYWEKRRLQEERNEGEEEEKVPQESDGGGSTVDLPTLKLS